MAPRGKRSSPEPGLPQSFDPYLRYAVATEFKTFESFEEESNKLSFLVEFKRGGLATSFERRMNEAGFEVELGPYDNDSRYFTLRTGTSAVTDPRAYSIWNDLVSRVEVVASTEAVDWALEARASSSSVGRGQRSGGAWINVDRRN